MVMNTNLLDSYFGVILSPGSTGDAVAAWQQWLSQQSLFRGAVDGHFGPTTTHATRLYQRQLGLSADGVVGPQTWRHVRDAILTPRAPFPPLVTNLQRQQLFGAFEFQPEPLPSNPENIRILGSWAAENILPVPIPQLSQVVGSPRSTQVYFHRRGLSQLTSLWQAWEQAGLLDRVLTWGGSYVPRLVRGSKTALSNHSFGTAFDINMAQNGLGRYPASIGQPGSVRELVAIAHQFGFYWGGHFARRDGMHFELARLL